MFSFITHIAWQTAQTIIAFSLLLPVVLHSIFYLQKKRQKQTLVSEELFEEKDFAIIVSVTHAGEKISSVIESLLRLHYTNYLVYVVRNKNVNLNFYTDDERVVWLTSSEFVTQPFGLQQHAINNFKRSHTHAVVLDGNCIADADFLNGLNVCFHQGFQVVQSRLVMPTNSGFSSQLYALRNVYNQFFQQYVLFELGSSATTHDSGIAFTVSFYKRYLQLANAAEAGITGLLKSMLIKHNFQVAFAKTALLFADIEKNFQQNQMLALQNGNGYSQLLWSRTQLLCKGIVCFDKNLFLSGLQLLRLPLLATLFLSIFCLFVNCFINPLLALFWMIGLCFFSISLLSAARWQASKRISFYKRNSVLYKTQSWYEKNRVDVFSAAQSF